MNEQQVILHISLIDGVGPMTLRHLLDVAQQKAIPLSHFYEFSLFDWVGCGISSQRAQLLIVGLRDQSLIFRELDLLKRNNISFVTLVDEEYPELLRHIAVPPSVLYYRGAPLASHKKCLAIIGSRQGTTYARQFIEKIACPLQESGWSIVSGGAIGVDTMAHQAMLDCEGQTIAVIGSGLLVPYPSSNRKLFGQIVAQGGTVVSPFPLTLSASKGTFPARNRIIAGLSRGTVVVQAGERSGTHITAQFALEEGREVFAVPGFYNDPLSQGCHTLIQQGAKLVTSVEDILAEFGESCSHASSDDLEPALDSIKEKILTLCREPISLDELAAALTLSSHDIQEHLFELQVEGVIEQNFMGLFQRR